jgi:hypothetical protein
MKFLKYEEKMKGKSNILAERITTKLAHWLINNNNKKTSNNKNTHERTKNFCSKRNTSLIN